jgi:hypothetical protein
MVNTKDEWYLSDILSGQETGHTKEFSYLLPSCRGNDLELSTLL